MEVNLPDSTKSKELAKPSLDEEFRVRPDNSSALSKVQVASLAGMIAGLYQLGYGVFNPLASTSTILFGAATILTSFMAYNWSNRTYDSEKELLNPTKTQAPVSGTSTLFVLTLLLALGGVSQLVNSGFSNEYATDRLNAIYSNPTLWESKYGELTVANVQGVWNTYHALFVISQIVSIFYFALVSVMTFQTTKSSESDIAGLASISGVLLLAFSLGMISTAGHALNYQTYPGLKELVSTSNLHWQIFVGVLMAGISLLSWLANYKKWRVGYLGLAVLLAAVLVLNVALSGASLGHSRTIYNDFKSTQNGQRFITRMSITAQNELLKAGCPNKYVEDSKSSFKAINWEKTMSLNPKNVEALNTGCAGVLAQLYAEEFYSNTSYSILATLSGAVLLIALYNLLHAPINPEDKDSKKKFLSLGIMLLVLSGFVFFSGVVAKDPIHLYPGNALDLQFGNVYATNKAMPYLTFTSATHDHHDPHAHHDYHDEFHLEDLGIDKKTAQEIYDFFDQKKKFIILQPTTNLANPVTIFSRGAATATYDSFVVEQKKTSHGMALVWIKVENIPTILLSVYLTPSTPKNIKDLYGDPAELEEFLMGELAYIYAKDGDDLILENVLQHNSFLWAYDWNDEFLYHNPKFTSSSGAQEAKYNAVAFDLSKDFGFDEKIAVEFEALRKTGAHKAVFAKFIPGKASVVVEKSLPKSTDFDGFFNSLPHSESRVILYNFEYEDRRRPIGIIWNPKVLKKEHKGLVEVFMKNFDNTAIPYTVEFAEVNFDIEILINIGAVPDANIRLSHNKEEAAYLKKDFLDKLK